MCDVCRLPHKPCCLIRPFAFIIIIITIFVVIAIIIIIIVILFCFNGYFLCFYFEYDYIVYFIFYFLEKAEQGDWNKIPKIQNTSRYADQMATQTNSPLFRDLT